MEAFFFNHFRVHECKALFFCLPDNDVRLIDFNLFFRAHIAVKELISDWGQMFAIFEINYCTIYIYIYILYNEFEDIFIMNRLFDNGLGDRGSIPGRVIPKTQKMVLDTALHNIQHFKIKIKGKVEQSREWSKAPTPKPRCSSY